MRALFARFSAHYSSQEVEKKFWEDNLKSNHFNNLGYKYVINHYSHFRWFVIPPWPRWVLLPYLPVVVWLLLIYLSIQFIYYIKLNALTVTLPARLMDWLTDTQYLGLPSIVHLKRYTLKKQLLTWNWEKVKGVNLLV